MMALKLVRALASPALGHFFILAGTVRVFSCDHNSKEKVQRRELLKSQKHRAFGSIKGQLGVPLTVCPWYSLRSLWNLKGLKPINTTI